MNEEKKNIITNIISTHWKALGLEIKIGFMERFLKGCGLSLDLQTKRIGRYEIKMIFPMLFRDVLYFAFFYYFCTCFDKIYYDHTLQIDPNTGKAILEKHQPSLFSRYDISQTKYFVRFSSTNVWSDMLSYSPPWFLYSENNTIPYYENNLFPIYHKDSFSNVSIVLNYDALFYSFSLEPDSITQQAVFYFEKSKINNIKHNGVSFYAKSIYYQNVHATRMTLLTALATFLLIEIWKRKGIVLAFIYSFCITILLILFRYIPELIGDLWSIIRMK